MMGAGHDDDVTRLDELPTDRTPGTFDTQRHECLLGCTLTAGHSEPARRLVRRGTFTPTVGLGGVLGDRDELGPRSRDIGAFPSCPRGFQFAFGDLEDFAGTVDLGSLDDSGRDQLPERIGDVHGTSVLQPHGSGPYRAHRTSATHICWAGVASPAFSGIAGSRYSVHVEFAKPSPPE